MGLTARQVTGAAGSSSSRQQQQPGAGQLTALPPAQTAAAAVERCRAADSSVQAVQQSLLQVLSAHCQVGLLIMSCGQLGLGSTDTVRAQVHALCYEHVQHLSPCVLRAISAPAHWHPVPLHTTVQQPHNQRRHVC
jgi:hypothetical protein